MMLEPCGALTGQTELTACLILCAPTGMNQAERAAWLKVARHELSGIPEDLLKRGCAAAKRNADHPAKIVPAIFREVGGAWETRKKLLREVERDIERITAEATRALPPPDVCTPEQARRIIAEIAEARRAKDA